MHVFLCAMGMLCTCKHDKHACTYMYMYVYLYIYINHSRFKLDTLLVIEYEPNQPNCNKSQLFHKILALRIFLHVVWLYVYMCSKNLPKE